MDRHPPSTTKRGAPDHFGQILVPARQRVRVIAISADPWPDQVPALGSGTALRGKACGKKGSTAKPRFEDGYPCKLIMIAIKGATNRWITTSNKSACSVMEPERRN
jgi:hypothetical protein